MVRQGGWLPILVLVPLVLGGLPVAAQHAEPSPRIPGDPGEDWEWYYLVDGQWRTQILAGREPTGGTVRKGRWPDGTVERHVVRDPGAAIALDPQGDVNMRSDRKGRPYDLLLMTAGFERPDAEDPDGSLHMSFELVGDAPAAGAPRVAYTWQIDTDLNGFPDLEVGLVGPVGGEYRPVMLDLATGEPAIDGAVPGEFDMYDDAGFAKIPTPSVGGTERVNVAAQVRLRDEGMTVIDRVPDTGWYLAEAYPQLDDLAPRPSPTAVATMGYLDAVAEFMTAYRYLTRPGSPDSGALRDAEVPQMYEAMALLASRLSGLGSVPEVARLVEALEGWGPEPAPGWLVLDGFDQEIGPLADAARAALGLPPRPEGEPV